MPSRTVSIVAGIGLEVAVSATSTELQKVAGEVVGLLSVKLSIFKAAMA